MVIPQTFQANAAEFLPQPLSIFQQRIYPVAQAILNIYKSQQAHNQGSTFSIFVPNLQ
jgi:hypothetical protein